MAVVGDQMRRIVGPHCLLAMKKEGIPETQKILDLTLEIIFLLTGEDFVLTRRQNGPPEEDSMAAPEEEESPRTPSHVTDPPPAKDGKEGGAMSHSNPGPCRAVKEVPVRCEDIAVYLSVEEWQYLEGHRRHYMDVVAEKQRPPIKDDSVDGAQPESCSGALQDQGCTEADSQDHQEQQDSDPVSSPPLAGGIIYCKEEDPDLMMADDSGDDVQQESCGSALYSQDCADAAGGTIAQDYQDSDPMSSLPPAGGIIHCKEEEEDPHLMATEPLLRLVSPRMGSACTAKDDHSEWNLPASSGSASWSQDCAEEDDDEMVTQAEAIEGFVCKQEEEDSHDLPIDLQGNQIDHHGCYPKPLPGRADPEGGVTIAHPPITSKRKEELPQVTDSPEPHSRVGCPPNTNASSSDGTTRSAEMLDGTSTTIYKCGFCRRGYSIKAELLVHLRTHSSSRLYRCTKCPQSFTEKSALSVHQWTFHQRGPVIENKPFSCDQCGRSFTKKSSLVKHQRLHTGAFACPDCGKCLSDKTGLMLHRRTHTGEKPFACSECGKRFTQMCHLVTHQSVHTGEHPFTCAECGKCFSIRSVLEAHLAVHARHKTWSCSDCGKCFTQKSALVTHQRVHRKPPTTH